MKLQIYSDLHLEFARFDPAPSDADVVILAGDIDIKSRGVKWASEVFQCPVIYVCGNHEYYGGHIGLNRPGFPRHSPGSLRNAFQTLPVTADC